MMQFVCDKIAFTKALDNVTKAVAVKSTQPAMELIRMRLNHDNLELTGYDMEFGIQCNIPVESDNAGELLADGKMLSNVAKKMMDSPDLHIMVDDQYVISVRCGNSNFSLYGMSTDTYVNLPMMNEEEDGISISQPLLSSMIRQTAFATSNSDAKPILMGELFDVMEDGTLNVVAIDGFRMAIRKAKLEQGNAKAFSFAVKKKFLIEISGMLSDDEEAVCNIQAEHQYVQFEFNGYTVFARRLEGEFYKYQSSMLNNYKTEVLINREQLVHKLELCMLANSAKDNVPVRCNFQERQLGLACSGSTKGKHEDAMDIQLQGDPLTIGFDNRYLLEALRAAECPRVRMQLMSPRTPACILPETGDEFYYLLMPMMLGR